jgi:hypothetical protein
MSKGHGVPRVNNRVFFFRPFLAACQGFCFFSAFSDVSESHGYPLVLYIKANMVSVCPSVCHKTFHVLTLGEIDTGPVGGG